MKHPRTRTVEAPDREAAPDELRVAYEIHTLAQMIYARLGPQAYAPATVPGFFH